DIANDRGAASRPPLDRRRSRASEAYRALGGVEPQGEDVAVELLLGLDVEPHHQAHVVVIRLPGEDRERLVEVGARQAEKPELRDGDAEAEVVLAAAYAALTALERDGERQALLDLGVQPVA